jgi:hypothetical protein
MLKKILMTLTLLVTSAVFLTGCSLIGSASKPMPLVGSETAPIGKVTNQELVTPVPTDSNSTALPDLEKDLNDLNLEPETFQ